MGKEAVKNIVVLIWVDLATNRQVGGRGEYFTTWGLERRKREFENPPEISR